MRDPGSRPGPGERAGARLTERLASGLRRGTIGLIRLYQAWVSPLLGPACRFYPSCSEYAVVSIERQGLRAGGTRALRRIVRCTPFRRGGLDLP